MIGNSLINNFNIGIGYTKFNKSILRSYSPKKIPKYYPFKSKSGRNSEYMGVVKALMNLNLDLKNFNTKNWNPLGSIIKEEDTVVLKPNLVSHKLKPWIRYESLITSPSIVRAVLDFVSIALKDTGKIIIADAPIQGTKFNEMLNNSGYTKMLGEFNSLAGRNIKIIDLRKEISIRKKSYQMFQYKNFGDPLGCIKIDLSDLSMHKDIEFYSEKFRVSEYSKHRMQKNHSIDHHSYSISRTILDADVVINLPKLKTHKYAGITCAMKNLVGIICYKDCLPHYRVSSRMEGGDEYLFQSSRKKIISQLEGLRSSFSFVSKYFGLLIIGLNKILKFSSKISTFPDPYMEGHWYGNDTIFRTIIDLNRILFYYRSNGNFEEHPVRKTINIVDAIVCGQGEGPLFPIPLLNYMVIAGFNSVAIDVLGCRILGLPLKRVPVLNASFIDHPLPLINYKIKDIRVNNGDIKDIFDFNGKVKLPDGWKRIRNKQT